MPAPSTPDNEDPLARLSRAIEVFAVFQEDGTESEAAFLARHADLRDLLEPMLAGVGHEAEPEGARYLGGYRLIRELGRGGMGVVFEAQEVQLGRRVALKVLPPHLTRGPKQIERFRREAAAAARLQHPGIVQVHGVGEDNGTHFFAMELVSGPTLRDVLSALELEHGDFREGFGEARLSPDLPGSYVTQTLEIVAQVAEAVAAAHQQGVIHRDLKPQNLMLDGGRVRVVDFGLARDLDRPGISQSKDVAGTPEYMSPEQALGLRATDQRTDVYSIGALLFELLTLRRPFSAESQTALLQAIQNQEAPSLRRLNPKVPRDVEVICRKCLEKLPAHRYATAEELHLDLRRFLRHEPIEARPPGSATRLLKFARRRTALTVAVLLATLLPAAGSALYFWVYRPHVDQLEAQHQSTMLELRDAANKQLFAADQLMDEPGRMAEAEAVTKVVVETCERLVALDDSLENRQFMAWARKRLGLIWDSYGELDRARAVWNQALGDLVGAADDAAAPEYRARRAEIATHLAGVLYQLGEEDAARARLADAAQDLDALRQRGVGVVILDSKLSVMQASLDYATPISRSRLRESVTGSLAKLDALPARERVPRRSAARTG